MSSVAGEFSEDGVGKVAEEGGADLKDAE